MKFNQNPSFRIEDFITEQDWIGKLFVQLNPFVQAVNRTFNQNIDFDNNIRCITRSYSLKEFTPITQAEPLRLQWGFNDARANDLRIMQATKGATQDNTVLVAAWNYDISSNEIRITNILEVTQAGNLPLSPGTAYTFTLRASV